MKKQISWTLYIAFTIAPINVFSMQDITMDPFLEKELQRGIIVNAIKEDNSQLLRDHLEKGYDANALDQWELTLAVVAIKNNALNCLDALIEYGARIEINLQAIIKNSLLSWTVFHNNKDCLRLLLLKGAHLITQNHFGQTPFAASCCDETFAIAGILLEAACQKLCKLAEKERNNFLKELPEAWLNIFKRRFNCNPYYCKRQEEELIFEKFLKEQSAYNDKNYFSSSIKKVDSLICSYLKN